MSISVRSYEIGILLLAPAMYLLVIAAVVTSGAAYCAWAKRNDGMDADQARAFAAVKPAWTARLSKLLAEIGYQALSLVLRMLHSLGALPSLRGNAGYTPVLIVPGYTENSGTMWPLGRYLARVGFNPILIDFPSTFHRIESNAAFLGACIAQIRAESGGAPIAVVAHSMGGLITRTWIHSAEEHGVSTLVAISSPFRGTHLARLGAWFKLGHCLSQMAPGSDFMRRFPPELTPKVPTLSMIASQENIVSPEWSAVIAGADVRVLSQPWGHQAPLFLREVFVQVESWLLEQGVTRYPD
jgi:pimeloyl-ACP methyl ester carboxylesterase